MPRREPETTNGAALAAGTAILVLGLAALLGWLAGNRLLVQVHPAFAPASFRSALRLLVWGSGFCALARGRRRLALACGVSILGVNLLLLLDHFVCPGEDPDRLLLAPAGPVSLPHPVPVAPAATVCFVLATTTLVFLSRSTPSPERRLAARLIGSVLLALGTLSAGGYLAGLVFAGGPGHLPRMAVLETAAFLAGGLGVLALAACRSPVAAAAAQPATPVQELAPCTA
jgi:hypothetical protein